MNLPIAPSVVSGVNPLHHYNWGKNCEAAVLVDNEEMTIKLEKMPAGAEEELHYHKRSQQFFFITKGKAVIEVDGVILFVHQGEGLLIEAGRQHKIMNKEEQTIEFILYSQPGVVNDRFSLA